MDKLDCAWLSPMMDRAFRFRSRKNLRAFLHDQGREWDRPGLVDYVGHCPQEQGNDSPPNEYKGRQFRHTLFCFLSLRDRTRVTCSCLSCGLGMWDVIAACAMMLLIECALVDRYGSRLQSRSDEALKWKRQFKYCCRGLPRRRGACHSEPPTGRVSHRIRARRIRSRIDSGARPSVVGYHYL